MTRDELLTAHVGHRCVLTTPTTLRCVDCSHLLDLSERPSTVRSTSTSTPILPGLHDPNACPEHPGQRAGACGPCRAEHLEAGPETCNTRPKGAPMPDDFRAQVDAARRTA